MADDILAKLAAPFPPEAVSWRVGSTTQDKKKGMALAYLDSRDVQDRLNEVCGLFWQVRTPWSVGGKLACEIGIKIGEEWIWRGDGAGDSDVEAEKGAFSDAFKRAAVRWGIGRYLYDVDSPWVLLKPMGKSFAIADEERPKLTALLRRLMGAPKEAPRAAAPSHPNGDSENYQIAVKPLADGTGSDWPHWRDVMSRAIGKAADLRRLDKLSADNRAGLDGLKAADSPSWGALMNAFAARRKQLDNKRAA